jgi:hypothetical protein
VTIELAPTHAEPWAPEILDLESLNAAATNAVVQSIEDLRRRAHARERGEPPPAIVAVGPAGAGKTHLFGRLRRKVGARGVFVHVRPLIGSEMTPRFLLGQIVQQLGYSSYGQSQIDIIAGTTLALAGGENPRFPAAMLQQLRELKPEDRQARVEQAIESLASPGIDTSYLERLLRVPFADLLPRTALLVWLGGRELDEAQARRVGVREALPDGDVISALRSIAAVAAATSPLVIVFDQLENLVDPDGSGARVIAYGNLIAELVDVVRDLVIVQMGLSTEWDANIERRLGPSQRSRVIGRRIPLLLPTPSERRALVDLWLKDAPSPLSEGQLQTLCDPVGLTPRMLLQELREALEGNPPAEKTIEPPDEACLAAWEGCLAFARTHIDEMAGTGHGPEVAFLLDGFVALASLVPELGPVKTERPNLLRLLQPKGPAFIAMVNQTNAPSVLAFLRTLAGLQGGVLALRERWREWPPTWKQTRAQWESLRKSPSVDWQWLERDQAVQLLALARLLKDARSGDVSGRDGKPLAFEAVEAWARAKLEVRGWAVTQALCGAAPREQLPEPAAVFEKHSGSAAGSIAILRALRVMSLERLIRETRANRAEVLRELGSSKSVRFIGDAIVRWVEE